MKYGRPHHLRLALCCPKDLDHLSLYLQTEAGAFHTPQKVVFHENPHMVLLSIEEQPQLIGVDILVFKVILK